MLTNNELVIVFNKTSGHCHFCGDSLEFRKYGVENIDELKGSWEADHIVQKGKGGNDKADNCLPSCVRCNRLRWHRKGDDLRELIFLGLIAKDEIKKKTAIGKELVPLQHKRLANNIKRRRKS